MCPDSTHVHSLLDRQNKCPRSHVPGQPQPFQPFPSITCLLSMHGFHTYLSVLLTPSPSGTLSLCNHTKLTCHPQTASISFACSVCIMCPETSPAISISLNITMTHISMVVAHAVRLIRAYFALMEKTGLVLNLFGL